LAHKSPGELLSIVEASSLEATQKAGAVEKIKTFMSYVTSTPLIGPTAGTTQRLASIVRQLGMTIEQYWREMIGLGPAAPKTIITAASHEEAMNAYLKLIGDSPGREAGLFRSPITGEYVVVQGEGDWVHGAVSSPDKIQPWAIVEHYHPERNRWVQFPSIADWQALWNQAGGVGVDISRGIDQATAVTMRPVRRVESFIRYQDAAKKEFHLTKFTIDPDLAPPHGPFLLSVETRGGAWVDYSFSSMAEYESTIRSVKFGEEIIRVRNHP
jgi:hypothetical protein